MLEVQREQLAYQKATLQAHDTTTRWRAFLSRWKEDFPSLSDACRQRAAESWSLSPLTLPHGLVRVIVAEQIYRAVSVASGHPYHRD